MNNSSQQTVLLGVTGSIAAYKACELLRLLQKAGLRVKVVMTKHAQELVGAATFRALSGESVAIDLFENPQKPINHIALAEEADVFVIAPCTANVLNKIANGVADDLLTTTALAATAPLVLAPAMNVHMLQNQRTQESLARLEDAGATIVGPGKGYLACGDEDSGRMSEPEEICADILEVLARRQSLAGKRVVITAGPTREFLDPVRFISSPSSGRTGFALAREARARGAEVVLISGPVALASPPDVEYVPVVSAEDMLRETGAYFDDADIAIFTAAVADFRPEQTADHKLKKGVDLPGRSFVGSAGQDVLSAPEMHSSKVLISQAGESSISTVLNDSEDAGLHDKSGSCVLRLTLNPDILATLAARRNEAGAGKPYVVGFAAETEDVIQNAQAKLRTKGADLIVANDVSNAETGFASTNNKLIFVGPERVEHTELLSKEQLAKIILDTIQQEL